MTLIGGLGHDRRTAEITTTSFKGTRDTVSFTGSRNGLSFVHHGRATTFRITLSAQGPRSAPAVFQSAPLPIGAGKTARIGGIRWASLVGSALRVSVGGRTLTVRNRFRPARLASISSLRVTKLRTRTASLTIRVALRKLPVGSQLAFAWIVRRSGRVVATHGLLAPAGTKTASFTFHARRAGRYTLKAIVSVTTATGGVAQSSSTTMRTLSFNT